MSNFDKHLSDEVKGTVALAGTVILLFIFFFVGTFIALIVAIGGGIYGAYKIYDIYVNTPEKQAEKQNLLAQQMYEQAVKGKPRTISREDFGTLVCRHLRGLLPDSVGEGVTTLALAIYDRENFAAEMPPPPTVTRSEERRVGKECRL